MEVSREKKREKETIANLRVIQMKKTLFYVLGFINVLLSNPMLLETFEPWGAVFNLEYSGNILFFFVDLFIWFALLISGIYVFVLKIKISFIIQAIAMISHSFRFIFILPIKGLDFFLFNVLVTVVGYPLLILKGYIYLRLGYSEKLGIFEKSTLERIMRVSNSIDLDLMRKILKMDVPDFNEKIIQYSAKYGMRVENNNLIINKDTLDEFLDSLDKQFEEWEISGQEKNSKIRNLI